MAEKPIPFSGPMVRAILEGRKTMTRRVVKPHPERFDPAFGKPMTKDSPFPIKSPYHVGDRLWVREPFTTFKSDSREEAEAKFQAGQNIKSLDDLYNWAEMPSGGGQVKVLYKADFGDWADNPDSDLGPWKSPRFMPRWASRITLEVTSVRVERLKSISEEDAKAEGAGIIGCDYEFWDGDPDQYRKLFKELWDSINSKKHPWASNPWVWVIEFKVVK